MSSSLRKSIYFVVMIILMIQTVFIPLGMVYAETMMETKEQEQQVESPPIENDLEDQISSPIFFFTQSQMQGKVNEPIQVDIFSNQKVYEIRIKLPPKGKIDTNNLLDSLEIKKTSDENIWLIRSELAQDQFTLPILFEESGVFEVSIGEEKMTIEITEDENILIKPDTDNKENEISESFEESSTNIPKDTEEKNLTKNTNEFIEYNDIKTEYVEISNWNQLVQAIEDNSVKKIKLMRDIFTFSNDNFKQRTENLEIDGNGYTLYLEGNSLLLGDPPRDTEKILHLNNINILFSAINKDFIRGNDSVAGGRWRILIEDTIISGSRRAVDARRSEVIIRGNTNIRTSRSNFALGSFVVEENSTYTSIVFNSPRAAVWYPRNVFGAAVTGKNSEFLVKKGATVNFYRENNKNANQPAVFRHFQNYIIEEKAKVNYFYQNQEGGVAPLGDQSASNNRPQNYTVKDNGELNIYTSNQMGIQFSRKGTSLRTEQGAKMKVLLVNQDNNIIPELPSSPGESIEDGPYEPDDEDEPDTELNAIISLKGADTKFSIINPRNVEIRSNAATDLFFLATRAEVSILDSYISVWQNRESLWEQPNLVSSTSRGFGQIGKNIMNFSDPRFDITNENYKRISIAGSKEYPDEKSVINIFYLDQNGNTVFPKEQIEGYIDIPIKIESAIPDGIISQSNYSIQDILTENGFYDEETYEFTPLDINASLTFMFETQKGGNITIRYTDGEGKKLLDDDIIEGNLNEPYTTNPKEIEGYVLKDKPVNSTGIFKEYEQMVTYIYEQQQYSLSFEAIPSEGGNPSAEKTTMLEGENTLLKANPNEKYQFEKWEVIGSGSLVSDKQNPNTQFTMGSENTKIRAVYNEKKLDVETKTQDIILGSDTKDIDLKKFIKSVSESPKGHVVEDFHVELIDEFDLQSVGKKTTTIKVTTDHLSKDVVVSYNIIWGHSIGFKATQGNETKLNEFTSSLSLLTGEKPQLIPTFGEQSLRTQRVGTRPHINIYRNSEEHSLLSHALRLITFTDSINKMINEWNENLTDVSLNYGDVTKINTSTINNPVTNELGNNVFVSRNNDMRLETQGYPFAYYMLTRNGYHLLRVNQLTTRNDIVVPFGASKEEMSQIASTFFSYHEEFTELEKEQFSFEFVRFDNTHSSNTDKEGVIAVTQTIEGEGAFTVNYDVVFEVDSPSPIAPLDPLNPEVEVNPESKPDPLENQGLLSIDFVSSFKFGSQAISAYDKTYHAQLQRLLNEDGTVNEMEERPNYIQISDRRLESERNGWELAVTQKEQFKSKEQQLLNGASLIFSNQQLITAQGGTAPRLQSVTCELIPGNRFTLLKAQGDEGIGTWIYRFGDADTAKESVTLNVPKGANPEAISYSTTLIWELSSVPDN